MYIGCYNFYTNMYTLKPSFILVFLVAFIHLNHVNGSVVFKREAETYDTKYDNVDVKAIVESKRLMLNYANCLLEKGPCTPEGKALRSYLPDAMRTNCTKCSVKQKEISGIVLGHLIHNYKDLYTQLVDKYDSDGSFRKQMEGDAEADEEEDEK